MHRSLIVLSLALALSACGEEKNGSTSGTGAGVMAGTGVTGGTAAAGTNATGGTGAPAFVPGSPTFSAVFNEVILAKCGGPFCHGGQISTLKMSIQQDTYDALINVPAMAMNTTAAMVNCADTGLMRVVPGDPDNSLFVQKLEATMDDQPCGTPMPPPPNVLDAALIAQVRMWIANGALND